MGAILNIAAVHVHVYSSLCLRGLLRGSASHCSEGNRIAEERMTMMTWTMMRRRE